MEVSVIIRTKNEEKWLKKCLVAVMNQDYADMEVIIVDSGSTDNTLKIAEQFPVKIIKTEGPYFPGKALNLGVKKTKGKYCIFLSAHCIPLNDKWIERYLVCFKYDEKIAGVYGRQEPLPDSLEVDKRDLWNVFGNEMRIQHENFFFHNANSIIPRKILEEVPFDETLPSIEDQAWGKEVLSRGYKIVYEPHASVYHPHGINQGNNPERAQRVVKVIELLQK